MRKIMPKVMKQASFFLRHGGLYLQQLGLAYEITWASVLFTCGLPRYTQEKASVQLRKCSPLERKGNVGAQFSKGKPAVITLSMMCR